ncbi:glycine cleavage system protein GcvH [uncultured Nitrosomonas sp.]|uniref:glycine cleavage system protein GcvH n=1 Tax=uncultured Nitrosomonas sp. TaxID=156424 RepID=UPI0026346B26|nr:glycine cleavage system protein GcvH [uncultured Nitrosomonas sp.]
MSVPAELKYTESHEWVKVEADGSVMVGITQHAQELLGDMVFVQLPDVGRTLAQREDCAVVESVKAASDIYAPLGGEVIAVNTEVEASPEKINEDCYAAWLFRLKPANAGEISGLLDANGYQKLLDSEAH